MAYHIIKNTNDAVKPDDTLYLLGDIVFGNKPLWRQMLSEIQCKNIILIKGNHDSYQQIPKDRFVVIVEQMIVRLDKNMTCLLSHYPYKWPWWRFDKRHIRHRDRRPDNKGMWLIYGHTHETGNGCKRMIHVGVDAHNFKPVSLDYILKIINTRR